MPNLALSAPPPETTMSLTLRNEGLIACADLGTLFTALAKDYTRINRSRTLTVYEVRGGSILVILADATAMLGPMAKDLGTLVEAGAAMTKFSRKLFNALGRAKESGGGVFEGGRKRDGQGSVEALLQIAVDADADVVIKQTSREGDHLEIKVTSVEATRIRADARVERYRLGGAQTARLIADQANRQIGTDDLAEKMLAITGPSGNLSDEARQVIAAMVAGLRDTGFEGVLTALAHALDHRGRHDIADLVRGHPL